MRIKITEQMGLVGSQQSRRRTMLDALFEQDEIFCLAVELIDLELVCKDGQIPFQKIDEDLLTRPEHRPQRAEIGRASCRERVCQYVEISVVAVSLKKNKKKANNQKREK